LVFVTNEVLCIGPFSFVGSLPIWPLPRPPGSPERPWHNGFPAGTLLGIQRKEVALESSWRGRDLGTLGTVGRSKIANILSTPFSRAGLNRPFLLAVALVEAVSQLRQRRKLDASLVARLPSSTAPFLSQRDGDDLRGEMFEVGRELPSGRIEALAFVLASGDGDRGVRRIRARQDAVMCQDLNQPIDAATAVGLLACKC